MKRIQMTPEQMYETYVGSITPEDFVGPFDGDADAAISSLMVDWPYNDPIPENFEHQIIRYLSDQGVAG